MIYSFNTGETQQSLREEYNPDGSVLRRAQLRLLEMLEYLDKVAKKIGIKWRIDGGNILGAIRHGGFIPWDDDIDIVVNRKDFKKLCKYLKSTQHTQFILQDHSTDNKYYKSWASLRDIKSEHISIENKNSKERKSLEMMKYRGLHIDIFPYEDRILPSLQHLSGKLACFLNFTIAPYSAFIANIGYYLLEKIIFPIFRVLGHIIGKQGEFMHSYGAWFYERLPKNVLLPYKPIIFENKKFNGPNCPEEFCKIIYGDYLSLPPKNKRNRHKVSIKLKE